MRKTESVWCWFSNEFSPVFQKPTNPQTVDRSLGSSESWSDVLSFKPQLKLLSCRRFLLYTYVFVILDLGHRLQIIPRLESNEDWCFDTCWVMKIVKNHASEWLIHTFLPKITRPSLSWYESIDWLCHSRLHEYLSLTD